MGTNRKNTTRKVVGSLGVIGTAAAVAGLGTFGTFTDSTTPIATTVDSGRVDINLTPSGSTIPLTISDFVPGDSLSRAVTLSNDGTTELSALSLQVTTSGTPNVLTTDSTNGLQLAVASCSEAWAEDPVTHTYSCGGTDAQLFGGAVLGTRALPGAASVRPDGVDNLLVTVSLPVTADTAFQGQSSPLSLTFIGTQRSGTPR